MKTNFRYAWRLKKVATMGQVDFGTRVKPSRKGYDRNKEKRSWKKDY